MATADLAAMRFILVLALLGLLAAITATCGGSSPPPDGHSGVCRIEGCPYVECCARYQACFQCEDAGTSHDAGADSLAPD